MQESGFDIPSAPEERADLHLHSTASDGRLTPPAVMRAAREAGLRAAALTDHDTLAGVAEARAAAESLGLEFVPGIELSTYEEDAGSTHILGYYLSETDPTLAAQLEEALMRRGERAREIVERLNDLGVGVTVAEIFALGSPAGLVTRAHIARALVDGGWISSYRAAFDRYLGADGPAYVPIRRLQPAQGIALIHGAGGVAVLAHPGAAFDEAWIGKLVESGLDGIEVLHPDHDRATVRRIRRLADRLGLLETGGSDWHGPNGGVRRLATQPVPYEWCRRMREEAAVIGRR